MVRRHGKRLLLGVLATAAALSLDVLWPGVLAPDAHAQTASDAFRNKTVNLTIGYAPGGGYDFYGRLVARHLGRSIPGNPNVVPQNMPGAGSLKAANYLYEQAPKNGTALGIVVQTLALEEALDNPAVHYKAARFIWIGRVTSNTDINMMWHTAKAQSVEDAKTADVPIAGTGAGSTSETIPKLLNGLIGTRFKVINGYQTSTDGMLAMERGEVDGAGSSWNTIKLTKPDWLRDRKVKIIFQHTTERHRELPDVPSLVDLGSTPADKQVLALYASGAVVGRSILAPPDVPADRVTILRGAFDAMLKDPAFLAEIAQAKAEFDPMPGERLQALVAATVSVSADVKQRAKTALAP